MRLRHDVVPVLALALCTTVVVACGGQAADDTTAETPGDTAGTLACASMTTDFAEDLDVDLGEMTQTPSCLYYEVLEEGQGLAADAGHVVVVHYTGWLPNGEVFDSSRESGEPFSFQLGSNQVIRGWEEGVTGMRIGETRKLVIPPDLAYGGRGAGDVIPPNATLVFEVELLEIRM